ncbi:MAG: ribonuclease M5 [Mycoplasma sp.]|nr:ribonuclease M5 [Mycoplasma sp.]
MHKIDLKNQKLNKPKIQQVVIVEGKTDTNHLKKLFNVDTIETNGSALNTATLNLIKQVASTRGVILFLDPDYTGNLIRKKISQYLNKYDEAFIIKDSWKTKKVGVNEASDDEIISALKNVIKYSKDDEQTLSLQEYQKLNINTYIKRKQICKIYKIPYSNNKQLLKRLNMLKITYKELKDKINEEK